MENFFMNRNNNPEEVEWVDEQIHTSDNDLVNDAVETHEESPVVEYIAEHTPVDNSELVIYATREFVVKDYGTVKIGYSSISKSDYEKVKHIKAIRLARPDEVEKFRK